MYNIVKLEKQGWVDYYSHVHHTSDTTLFECVHISKLFIFLFHRLLSYSSGLSILLIGN